MTMYSFDDSGKEVMAESVLEMDDSQLIERALGYRTRLIEQLAEHDE